MPIAPKVIITGELADKLLRSIPTHGHEETIAALTEAIASANSTPDLIACSIVEEADKKPKPSGDPFQNKIVMIKELRSRTGCGLAEAKQSIERSLQLLQEKRNQPISPVPTVTPEKKGPFDPYDL